MDWLSKRKFVIVCHEKVVRIPLEGDEILRVHGERTQGVMKTLMNAKLDEPKLSDIFVVRDFMDVIPEDLLMITAATTNIVGDALSRKERVKSRRVLLVGSVMDETHASRYLVHPGADKTYYNLEDMYWQPRVEKDIATYVNNYDFQDRELLARIYIDEINARNEFSCGALTQIENG
ncbi:putative reverse transcriptase domain-containing protein [Tanacetum coccineum]